MRKAALFLGAVGMVWSLSAPAESPLSLQERVRAREAIERVYDAQRIWPEENPGPKPVFEESGSRFQIEARVDESLRKEAALREIWGKRVTPEMLQWEIDRMARASRRPEVLAKLWDALGRDPRLIAECLVRPLLVDRLLEAAFEADRRQSADVGGPSGPMATDPAGGSSRSEAGGFQTCSPDFQEWWESVREEFEPERLESEGSYRLPRLQEVACLGDTWMPTSPGPSGVPYIRGGGVAVWTGSEMIIWGDSMDFVRVAARYNPATDSWAPVGLDGAPYYGSSAAAVWTGTEMMIWGGKESRYGGLYNPATDTWTPTSTAAGCPTPRDNPGLVWTGTEAIAWGGSTGSYDFSNSGARYNPATRRWTPLPPYYIDIYDQMAAVWTGSQLVVWGRGMDSQTGNVPVGARWDLATNQWLAMSQAGAPERYHGFSTVWTGTEMIVWGGSYEGGETSGGGIYDPAADAWRPTGLEGAPSPRINHTAVWTGTEMLVWGGDNSNPAGGRYRPATDTWLPITTAGVPENRSNHVAVWTGTEMIVFGVSSTDPGGRYDPAADRWTQIYAPAVPGIRADHTAVWTGSEMIVWGGSLSTSRLSTGGRYDPATDMWSRTAYIGKPTSRQNHGAVWTGTEMLLWGGQEGNTAYRGDGARYDPAADTWTAMGAEGAPSARIPLGAWTGTEFLIWGGTDATGHPATGARYDPASDSWTPIATDGAPADAAGGAVAWTGNVFVIWGGTDNSYQYTRKGGRYNPATDTWAPTSDIFTHWTRYGHTAVWTGSKVAFWGGYQGSTGLRDGGLYDPVLDMWTYLPSAGAPEPRTKHTAIWTGSEMIVWGGGGDWTQLNTGGVYNPAANQWVRATSTAGAPGDRNRHTAVWTGSEMIVWGGKNTALKYLNDGGRYCAGAPPPPDFQVGLLPSTLEILQGETGIVAARVTSVGGFTQAVDLSCSGAPAGVTCELDPTSVTPTAGGTAEGALGVTAASSAVPGTYALEVSGTGDGRTRSASLALTVLPSAPCSLSCEAWALPSAGGAPLPVSFSASVTARNCSLAPSFWWDFGDGQTSTSQNPKHTYSAPGSYVWTLTVNVEGLVCARTCDIAVGAFASGLPGDCDGDDAVSVGEIQKVLNMFLGLQQPACWADFSGDGSVTVGDVQRVVNQYLGVVPECSQVGTGRGGAP